MNRRKAIVRIVLATAGTTAAVSGYKWYTITRTPDLSYLNGQKALIASLADTIIPATDSPGAKEAGVENFIITMIKDCTERKAQNKFIDGLKELQNHSVYHYKKLFQDCSEEQRIATLKQFEKMGTPAGGIIGKIQRRYLGQSFFTTLKQYTVEGYCTSQAGATKGLAYVHVPGRYEGCITMQPGQKAWATT